MMKKINTKSTRKNCVIYARYSSSAQSEQSIEGQISINTEFAKKNDYTIIDTYIDRAMTRRNDDRPAFQQMIKDSANKNFDYVLVYKLDRFSRNRYDNAINKKALRDNGVKAISATETISDTPEGVLFESMLEGYNEYYSAELSQKVRRGIKESHKKGQYTGGSIPLGYDLISHKLVINEAEAEIVKMVFNKCATGSLFKDVFHELNSKGIKSKAGTPFNGMTISRIVNNEHYLGRAIYDDEVYDNIFPKIIEEPLFNACQEEIKKNKKRSKFLKWHHFLLSGKVFCMDCGLPMHGDCGTSKTYRYYKCNGVKKHLNDCKKYPVRQAEIEEYVLDKIKQYVLETNYLRLMSKQMADYFNANLETPSELKLLEQEQTQNEKEIANIVKAIKMGIITESTKTELEKLDSRKAVIENEIIKIKSRYNTPLKQEECYDFLYSLTSFDLNIDKNRQLLVDRFVKRVEIADKKINILFYPLDKPGIDDKKSFNISDNENINASSLNKPLSPPKKDNGLTRPFF